MSQAPDREASELLGKCQALDELVKQRIVSNNPNTYPITDGIIDVSKYLRAKYKILWILKEPYCDVDDAGNPSGGDWSLPEMIASKQSFGEFSGGKPTFKPMLYTSWGILNDFCLWSNMRHVEDEPSMLEALKSIAYINTKKLPGHTSSAYSVIQQAYHDHKDILLQQLECFNPEIIIGGYTLRNFYGDLNINEQDMVANGSNRYIIKGGKLYIDAYHPAQRPGTTGVSQEQYCNDIINAAKLWSDQKS